MENTIHAGTPTPDGRSRRATMRYVISPADEAHGLQCGLAVSVELQATESVSRVAVERRPKLVDDHADVSADNAR